MGQHRYTNEPRASIIQDFIDLFPEDMPDFEQATSNLLPLKINAQINVHYPNTENRLGVEVRRHLPLDQNSL